MLASLRQTHSQRDDESVPTSRRRRRRRRLSARQIHSKLCDVVLVRQRRALDRWNDAFVPLGSFVHVEERRVSLRRPREVALMMIGLKLARESHKPMRDNLVDIGGYLNCVDLIDEATA